MFAPRVTGVMQDFHSNNELLASFVVSVFVLGFGAGPMILAPLSEMYGRLPVYYSGTYTIFVFIFMQETYGKIILQKKTDKLIKQTGNKSLKSKLDDGLITRGHIEHAIIRPVKLQLFSPIVLSLSIFQGICFGCLYLLFTTFSMVYTEQYHWNSGTDGLSFMGMGIGSLSSLLVLGYFFDQILLRKAGKGEKKPEYRLSPMIPTSIFISAGLFWYGWGVQAKDHWIVPILGTVLVGFGYLPVACVSRPILSILEEADVVLSIGTSTDFKLHRSSPRGKHHDLSG
ncbi:hypothetical protein G7Y89_g5324 [Cudoniella acicularis]|uniref:Major facilitator superfamily (MFS) profile domain-containing protein n=1 Tax=Cudoniella acicularis TaxID=354080 RepID=A0A8H4RPV9_9HELO|nr:hypothetical protein G7Y89_g5324 [Cudoniella acicularis]